MTPRIRALWRNLVHRNRVERDLDDELRTAFELLVEDGIRRGLDPQSARRAATLRLGRVESIQTHVRQVRTGALIDAFAQDVRYGARLLRRQPLFSLTAVLSLAICLAANTTVFSIANRLLFRQAAGVVDPGRLVDIAPVRRDGGFTEPVLPYRTYDDIRRQSRTLESVYGYQLDISAMSLRGSEAAERVFGTTVTSTYFTALGVRPAVGRLFGPSDSEAPGASPLVVLGHGFWMRRFNGDPSVIGQTLHLNGSQLTVIGVTPADFHGLSLVVADVWLPVGAARGQPRRDAPRGRRPARGGRHHPSGRGGDRRARPRASSGDGLTRRGRWRPSRGRRWRVAGGGGVSRAGGRARGDLCLPRHAHGARRAGPGDRVRERRGRAARASHGTPSRDRGAPGDRRGAIAADPSAPDGDGAPVRRGRRCGPGPRARDDLPHRPGAAGPAGADRHLACRSTVASSHSLPRCHCLAR